MTFDKFITFLNFSFLICKMGVMVFLSNNKVNWVSEHSLMVGGVQEEPKVNKSPRSWTERILILDILVLFFSWDVRPT